MNSQCLQPGAARGFIFCYFQSFLNFTDFYGFHQKSNYQIYNVKKKQNYSTFNLKVKVTGSKMFKIKNFQIHLLGDHNITNATASIAVALNLGIKINVIKTELPGIMTFQEQIQINKKLKSWSEILELHNLCHICVIERHNKNGEFAHGFIKNFNLKQGAVASSVGHDAHNIIIAGLNLSDMKFALEIINKDQGGIVIVNDGKVISKVELPIAGLISDKKATEVSKETAIFKQSWEKAGCTLPYMGFNLLPLSVIPNFRITNKGLVDVNTMSIVPLFE